MGNKATATAAQKTEAPKVEAPVAEAGPSLSKAQQKICDGLPTVSARIRYLAAEGFTRSQTTKLITNAKGGQLLYQHVRNVLESTPPAKAD